jgi:isoprenylcysteine carboxyl methyltransferase (ICMT) family protein YpbQ
MAMSPAILSFFAVAGALRLATLAVSVRHERHLKERGAVEHGAGVTRLLAFLHVAFYPICFLEGWSRGTQAGPLTYAAMGVYLASMAVLFHVISQLGELWTVKLIVAPGHHLVQSPLFRWVRHPNYFLNLVPELAAVACVAGARTTLAAVFPLYLLVLSGRIVQEERVMRRTFDGY